MINDEPFLSYHMTKYFKGSIHALCTQKDESVYSSSEAVKPINNSTFTVGSCENGIGDSIPILILGNHRF